MALKLHEEIKAIAFETITDAHNAIGKLKMKPISLGRKFSVVMHPVNPNLFAIAILVGGTVAAGYVA